MSRSPSSSAHPVAEAAQRLGRTVHALHFPAPVHIAYNPLQYALHVHLDYARKFGQGRKKILFVGMNPGPFGMMQTGIPFGEIKAVREFLKLEAPVPPPALQHPKRPIQGFLCKRSEVSGRRLWGLFQERFKTADRFFKDHYVLNYCPLAFLDEGGRNLTPDKLRGPVMNDLFKACDEHLKWVAEALQVEFVVGVGDFAEKRARESLSAFDTTQAIPVVRILHPSPANPAANKDWAGAASRQLIEAGVWPASA